MKRGKSARVRTRPKRATLPGTESAFDRLVRVLAAFQRDIDRPAPAVALSTDDFDWLGALLCEIAGGEDVRPYFHEAIKGREPDPDYSVFIALDVAVRRASLGKVIAARTAVAADWLIQEHEVKRCEQHARTLVAQLLRRGINDGHMRMIEWHRARYLEQK